MFYPADSLKRGGRFHLCWIADSWPLRFATVTHRQLWSHDIRNLCDALLKVMADESGRPAKRFSLRLSSQLMRGLARIYQKKVNILLGDLCMINANVMKHSHKKWNVHEVLDLEVEEHPQLQQLPHIVVQDVQEFENERRLEEMIVNSGNVVRNIQQITLKEAAIPEFQLPPNDGFGEENPDQSLQLLAQERTLEMMLNPEAGARALADTSVVQRSASALDLTDRTHDKSRLVQDAQMEQISELDATMMRKSTGGDLLPVADFEKDIPEIPEILPPELPAPEIQLPQEREEHMPRPSKPIVETPKQPEPEDIELEELEQIQPLSRRRRKTKLIIDKKIKLSANILRSRIENTEVELRCETSSDDIVDNRIPPYLYFGRPSHAGIKVGNTIANAISRLFMRNLGVVNKKTLPEREIEEAIMDRSNRTFATSVLERIIEEAEEQQEIPQTFVEEALKIQTGLDISKGLNASEIQRPSVEEDIADLPTQKILTLSQVAARKRKSLQDTTESPKKPRHMGMCRMSQRMAAEAAEITDAEKENIPFDYNIQVQQNIPIDQDIPGNMEIDLNQGNITINQVIYGLEHIAVDHNTQVTDMSVTAMLQQAGLADIQPYTEKLSELEGNSVLNKTIRRPASNSSETPLGSLDRTRVSLGDSEQTTDSRRFIRDQWGTEGSMIKILNHIRQNLNVVNPLTVEKMIDNGPVIPGYRRMIAARCFNSTLKLKQNGFIKIVKDPGTLEIRDIILGPKFDFTQATSVA